MRPVTAPRMHYQPEAMKTMSLCLHMFMPPVYIYFYFLCLVLQGHRNWVLCVLWSPDGALVASGDMDGNIWLWDPATGKPLGTCKGHSKWITSLVRSTAFHPMACFVHHHLLSSTIYQPHQASLGTAWVFAWSKLTSCVVFKT